MWIESLKITGCVLIITSSTGMGLMLGNEIKRRIEDLKSAKTIALLLRGDIRYAHTTLPEALENVAKRHEGRYTKFLNKVSKELKSYQGVSFSQVWKKAMETELDKTALSKKDREDWLAFGEQLGYLDKDMQINHIDWYITQVEENMKEVTDDAKDKIKLYRSLGILFGILITILVI